FQGLLQAELAIFHLADNGFQLRQGFLEIDAVGSLGHRQSLLQLDDRASRVASPAQSPGIMGHAWLGAIVGCLTSRWNRVGLESGVGGEAIVPACAKSIRRMALLDKGGFTMARDEQDGAGSGAIVLTFDEDRR